MKTHPCRVCENREQSRNDPPCLHCEKVEAHYRELEAQGPTWIKRMTSQDCDKDKDRGRRTLFTSSPASNALNLGGGGIQTKRLERSFRTLRDREEFVEELPDPVDEMEQEPEPEPEQEPVAVSNSTTEITPVKRGRKKKVRGPCIIIGCDNTASCKGLCGRCYARKRYYRNKGIPFTDELPVVTLEAEGKQIVIENGERVVKPLSKEAVQQKRNEKRLARRRGPKPHGPPPVDKSTLECRVLGCNNQVHNIKRMLCTRCIQLRNRVVAQGEEFNYELPSHILKKMGQHIVEKDGKRVIEELPEVSEPDVIAIKNEGWKQLEEYAKQHDLSIQDAVETIVVKFFKLREVIGD